MQVPIDSNNSYKLKQYNLASVTKRNIMPFQYHSLAPARIQPQHAFTTLKKKTHSKLLLYIYNYDGSITHFATNESEFNYAFTQTRKQSGQPLVKGIRTWQT